LSEVRGTVYHTGDVDAFSYSFRVRVGENVGVKFVIAMALVLTVLVGSLFAFLRGRRDPMGSPEVLERAKQRNRELEEEERREDAR
jgi:hypothetical protein